MFANNTILPCFSLFFLIINLHFLIPPVISQIFILIAEFAIPIGTPTDKANVEIKTQPLTADKKEKFQSNLKSCSLFYALHSLNRYISFDLKDNLLYHPVFLSLK